MGSYLTTEKIRLVLGTWAGSGGWPPMVSRFPCCVLSYFSLVFVMEHNWQIQVIRVSWVGKSTTLALARPHWSISRQRRIIGRESENCSLSEARRSGDLTCLLRSLTRFPDLRHGIKLSKKRETTRSTINNQHRMKCEKLSLHGEYFI